MAAPSSHYTRVAITLHWLIAAAIIFQLGTGWRLGVEPKGPGAFALFQLHKSIGVTILLLSLLRLGWRLTHRPPSLPAGMPHWEVVASKITHAAFYFVMIALPLTGWILVSTSRTGIPTVLYGLVPWPHLPVLATLPPESKALWHEAGENGHGLLALLTLALLGLHVGAVLKHQLIVRDEVLAHMAPGARPGWREPRLWLALLLAAGVAVLAWFMPLRAATPAAPGPTLPEPVPVESAVSQEIAPTSSPTQNSTSPATPIAGTPTSPARWQVAKASTLDFATSWSGEPVTGRFKRWQADITFDPQALAQSKISVSVDLASVSTGDEQRDSALPETDWFDAAHHPRAEFTSRRIRATGPTHYQAEGTLTLRGHAAPVTLDFDLRINGGQANATGTTTLDRTVFGVGQGEWSATDAVPAQVKVSFALTANRR